MVNFLALSLLLCDNEPLPNIKRTLNIENMSIDIITSYFVGHRISQIIKQIINGSKWEKNVFENDKIDLQLRIIFRFVLKDMPHRSRKFTSIDSLSKHLLYPVQINLFFLFILKIIRTKER